MSTLISGGAQGADQLFEQLAKLHKHTVKIYKSGDVVNTGGTEGTDQYLVYLNNKYLHRTYPTRNEYVNGLLRRDVTVGLEPQVMFAISSLDSSGKISGGTAWASYTFIERYAQTQGQIPFYLFDQNRCEWLQASWDNNGLRYNIINAPNIPLNVVYAGIGTRELNHNGINAIKGLF